MIIDEDSEDSDKQPLLKMSRSDDPFYTIRDEVKSQADQVKIRYEKFLDLVKAVDTSTNVEFIDLRNGLIKEVRVVVRKLKGLKDAIDVVEKNRSKFPLIKDSELQQRKLFVDTVQAAINEVRAGMESSSVRKKLESDTMKTQRANLATAPPPGSSSVAGSSTHKYVSASSTPLPSEDPYNDKRRALKRENDSFVSDQKQVQLTKVQQQNDNLARLEMGVTSLGAMASEINQELKEQDKLIDGLGNEVDDASNRLNTVLANIQKLLKSKDSCQIWAIVILTFILVILIALVIWT